jgi:short-subunit dehydrogenase
MKLDNKTILITGASSGFGKAVALRMAKDNCNLILTARNLEKIALVEAEIKQLNPQVKTKVILADLTKLEDIKRLFAEIKEYTGSLDLVFNNAGLGHVDDLVKQTDEQIKEMIDVNVTSMILVSKYVSEMMIPQNYGHIIMTSSLAGLISVPQWSVYVATKWAITGFAASLEMELKPYNILVSTIHPGPVDTEFFSKEKADIKLNNLTSVIPVSEVSEKVYSIALKKGGQHPIPSLGRFFAVMYRFFPGLTKKLIKRTAKPVR